MEQWLPKALTYYLEVEAVTEDHAKQPSSSGTSTVRSIYQNCSPKKSTKKALPLYTPPKLRLHSSWKLAQESSLLSLCVYDMPLPSTVMVEGCRVFADYVSKHNGQVPNWVVAAFWWLSYAVDGSLSVDDWTVAIERW